MCGCYLTASFLEAAGQAVSFVHVLPLPACQVEVSVVGFLGYGICVSEKDEQSGDSHLIWVPSRPLMRPGRYEAVAAGH